MSFENVNGLTLTLRDARFLTLNVQGNGNVTTGAVTLQRRMRSVLKKIRFGQFAREFIREMKPPRTRYAQLLLDAEKHPIEKVDARLRGMMAWRAKM